MNYNAYIIISDQWRNGDVTQSQSARFACAKSGVLHHIIRKIQTILIISFNNLTEGSFHIWKLKSEFTDVASLWFIFKWGYIETFKKLNKLARGYFIIDITVQILTIIISMEIFSKCNWFVRFSPLTFYHTKMQQWLNCIKIKVFLVISHWWMSGMPGNTNVIENALWWEMFQGL